MGPKESSSNEPALPPALSGLVVVLLLLPICLVEKLEEVGCALKTQEGQASKMHHDLAPALFFRSGLRVMRVIRIIQMT